MRVLSSSKKVTKLSKDRKFGTDGVRGPVETTMNPLFVTKLGWAAGSIFMEEGISTILIGKDTRISGYMLESALQAGLISSGIDSPVASFELIKRGVDITYVHFHSVPSTSRQSILNVKTFGTIALDFL